ncbi:hypothetical protein H2200_005885 [Cladophialophora chaetospira]|uniref:Uncharacterized protein n=1 Tax=Cladophialophora chaetospira TaxID=386627 RepID=A0AA38XAI4_9EURO|nr:hypothetical protein H2200_005885 [Cladophialophora chaetospira]
MAFSVFKQGWRACLHVYVVLLTLTSLLPHVNGSAWDILTAEESKALNFFSTSTLSECTPDRLSLRGDDLFHPAEADLTPRIKALLPPTNITSECHPLTPLLIPFESNTRLLQQTLLSYIAEGWPPGQIIVIDNSGASFNNLRGWNSPTEHTFLDCTLLRREYGVNVRQLGWYRRNVPELENLMLSMAKNAGRQKYYTSAQHVIVRNSPGNLLDLSTNNATFREGWKSFHAGVLKEANQTKSRHIWERGTFTFFDKNHLVKLVNVDDCSKIGAWDTRIEYDLAECDYLTRTRQAGYPISYAQDAGVVYDVDKCLYVSGSDSLEDALISRRQSEAATYHAIEKIQADKHRVEGQEGKWAVTWQGRQYDGEGRLSHSENYGHLYAQLRRVGRWWYEHKWRTDRCDPFEVREMSCQESSLQRLGGTLGNLFGF